MHRCLGRSGLLRRSAPQDRDRARTPRRPLKALAYSEPPPAGEMPQRAGDRARGARLASPTALVGQHRARRASPSTRARACGRFRRGAAHPARAPGCRPHDARCGRGFGTPWPPVRCWASAKARTCRAPAPSGRDHTSRSSRETDPKHKPLAAAVRSTSCGVVGRGCSLARARPPQAPETRSAALEHGRPRLEGCSGRGPRVRRNLELRSRGEPSLARGCRSAGHMAFPGGSRPGFLRLVPWPGRGATLTAAAADRARRAWRTPPSTPRPRSPAQSARSARCSLRRP